MVGNLSANSVSFSLDLSSSPLICGIWVFNARSPRLEWRCLGSQYRIHIYGHKRTFSPVNVSCKRLLTALKLLKFSASLICGNASETTIDSAWRKAVHLQLFHLQLILRCPGWRLCHSAFQISEEPSRNVESIFTAEMTEWPTSFAGTWGRDGQTWWLKAQSKQTLLTLWGWYWY